MDRLAAHDDVFRNGHHRSEHEVLMDHADAQGNGLSGPANRNGLSIHQNFSRIRGGHAVKHVHQRGFACAVFPQQGVDFPLLHGEGHVVQGSDTGVDLGNAPHFNGIQWGSAPPFS